MSPYPEVVERRVGILTRAGWLTGTLRVPKLHTLADHVETAQRFFRLSDVQLPDTTEKVPFLALQRSAAIFITPLDGQMRNYDRPVPEVASEEEIAFLFDHSMLVGTVDVLYGTRVSDMLMHQNEFIPVRRCSLRAASYLPPEAYATHDFVLVNRLQILGVVERTVAEKLPHFRSPSPHERLSALTPHRHDV
jgi:hypothetical protein